MIMMNFIAFTRACRSGFLHVPCMQPAFLLCGIFPPPAPLALMLSGEDWLRTGLASDADKTLFMEFVIWNIVFTDIIPDLF